MFSFQLSVYTACEVFLGGSVVKNLPANAGDLLSVPGLGRSRAGENGNPLQCSCLENSTDRRTWWATVHKQSDMTEHIGTHTVYRQNFTY